MKIKELNKSKLPIIRIDKSLDKYEKKFFSLISWQKRTKL
jgi:hypothetical protein